MVLAADCVYDDGSTAELLATLAELLPALPRGAVCLVALERRVNFCLAGMRPRAPAAEFFHAALARTKEVLPSAVPLGDVPQSFAYERVDALELTAMTSSAAASAPRAHRPEASDSTQTR